MPKFDTNIYNILKENALYWCMKRSLEYKMKAKDTRSLCVLKEYTQDNNHARFDSYSHDCCKETYS